MTKSERSMTKSEFEQIARATLDEMDLSNFKIVMIDSAIEAALETPAVFMAYPTVLGYTTTDTIYFYWYILKNFTYTFQLNKIRHEAAHAMTKELIYDEETGMYHEDTNQWRENIKSFSLPNEEKFRHGERTQYELNSVILHERENRKPKFTKVSEDSKLLAFKMQCAFIDLECFLDKLGITKEKPNIFDVFL